MAASRPQALVLRKPDPVQALGDSQERGGDKIWVKIGGNTEIAICSSVCLSSHDAHLLTPICWDVHLIKGRTDGSGGTRREIIDAGETLAIAVRSVGAG